MLEDKQKHRISLNIERIQAEFDNFLSELFRFNMRNPAEHREVTCKYEMILQSENTSMNDQDHMTLTENLYWFTVVLSTKFKYPITENIFSEKP
jgi:hypothetical protein